MRTIRMRSALPCVSIGMAVLLAGCSSASPGQPTVATTAATTAAATTAPATADLGEGLSLAAPDGATVEPFERRAADDCTSAQARVKTDQGWYDLWLVGARCPQDTDRAINGNHGRYLTPPSYATDVSTATTVAAGSLVTFRQTYTECTNSCADYQDAIGLVTLTAPNDKDLPVLMIVAPRDVDGDLAAVTALAATITPN